MTKMLHVYPHCDRGDKMLQPGYLLPLQTVRAETYQDWKKKIQVGHICSNELSDWCF